MTLICRFTARQVPTVYLGDLLVTTEGKSTKPLHLPSWSDINSRLAIGAQRYVSGLTQKLNILSERVIVAWAGSRIQAISMLRMIEQAANQRAGFDEIGRLVSAVPKEDRDKLHLIGSVIEPSPDQQTYEVKHFSVLARKQCVEGIDITAVGSGVDFLFALAPQLLERMSGQTDKYRIALGLSMGVSASLIGHEAATGANLTEWWGGGIETAVLDNGNFTKIGNTLHRLWTATIRADGDIDFVLLPKFIKYDYLQDALVVRAIEIDLSGPTEGNARLTDGIHTFTPLLKDKNHYDWTRVQDFTLHHDWLCARISIEGIKSQEGFKPVLTFVRSGRYQPGLLLEKDGNQFRIGFHSRFTADLYREVKSAITTLSNS